MVKTAVILAAGLGSRLNERTKVTPKGFLELGGLPLVERSILNLLEAGIDKIWIGIGYLSEFYEGLAKRYEEVSCVHNAEYAASGSMYTLSKFRNCIHDDFLLLESDLLYDPAGIKELLYDRRKNVILASGETLSQDEVYIETDDHGNLVSMSKDPASLDRVDAELVGICKVSLGHFQAMCELSEEIFKTNLRFDYEQAMAAIAAKHKFAVKKSRITCGARSIRRSI
ncbi:phosphocholine cytidylyltransferase family protein [Paenibacillus hexagrammi]|uniref:Phosphocholine cytidylyltransferase family protein n=1 Tax=Paenibacillus hexagrammi TaxID=2908839 RepID=A0ABY3SGP7_9BACL|nr:phosphocholine cytidylyltransferase family protein [Paenibacillus sp. YPD9-1]UJF33218.1 phosphocholine cytidylyltransferase family protein [Paenibacillus sp. YPD9-1]